MGVSFLAQNTGKRSITINMKSDKGKALFKRLAQVGRAPGFHLILATQQPRANIVTTAIAAMGYFHFS